MCEALAVFYDGPVRCVTCRFADAVNAERERCAKIVEAMIDPEDEKDPELYSMWAALTRAAKEIRNPETNER